MCLFLVVLALAKYIIFSRVLISSIKHMHPILSTLLKAVAKDMIAQKPEITNSICRITITGLVAKLYKPDRNKWYLSQFHVVCTFCGVKLIGLFILAFVKYIMWSLSVSPTGRSTTKGICRENNVEM